MPARNPADGVFRARYRETINFPDLTERLREWLGVPARVDLVPRGGLPRFAYKAARVVDA